MYSVWKAIASGFVFATLTAGLTAGPAHAFQEVVAPGKTATADKLFQQASSRAANLAATPYVQPAADLPKAFDGLDYDGYRKLRPRPETMVWGKTGNPFAVLPLPRGGLYNNEVAIYFVDAAGKVQLHASPAFVDFVDFPSATDGQRAQLGASGWRAITKPGQAGVGYEFAVFQGATYFRAVGHGQTYGVSARALAIGTGSPGGEEFPRFTDFWIIEPSNPGTEDESLTFIALADSPAAAAAYRFVLRPGSDATIDVAAEIHPRVDISEAGVAPLSSMYLRGQTDPHMKSDARAEVHDSDGLSILSSSGEHIWRPLANPSQVQMSAFGGGIAGFGLEQRHRDAATYADSEARYERRPSVWIEPVGNWGAGEVRLLEIPTASEYADNVAAFWRPTDVWRAGSVQRLAYRLHWTDAPPQAAIARVMSTRIERAPEGTRLQRITIDFAGQPGFASKDLRPDVWATSGVISNIQIIPGADTRVLLSFDLEPGASPVIELHAALADSNSQQTETWLFRWTPE
ncbi:MAG: glucan biosynthesis protein [Hyphomonadaceae bacterium]|nr:glucan biosynthesis protein [Hyphomonadaceae bacterium]